jgi:hypothetical protein
VAYTKEIPLKADSRFTNQPMEFWAYVRLVSQRLGYYQKDASDEGGVEQGNVSDTEESAAAVPRPSFEQPVNIMHLVDCLNTVKVRLSVKYNSTCQVPGMVYDPDLKTLTTDRPISMEHEAELISGDLRKGWKKCIEKLAELSRQLPKLDIQDIFASNKATDLGNLVVDYLNARRTMLSRISMSLMNRDEAKIEFETLRASCDPKCRLPMNKQKNAKGHLAYLTCIVNMLTEKELGAGNFDDDPRGLTTLTVNGKLARTFSRWLDGAYPEVHDPVAIWEVKEYYGTTSFGSRVADGVYESMLDGFEISEASTLGARIRHYLIVDDKYTWWVKGKSYLCRLIDIMHMGLVDEVLYGREVLERWPQIVREWTTTK